jgi:acyl-CoA thioesterase-2
MVDMWGDLLACLDLTGNGPETFEGPNLRLGYHRLFGGQILAQFVRAAARACPGKSPKSMCALFATEGRPDEPVRYEARTVREGSSFASVTIAARQRRGVIANALLSFHAAEDGPDRQTVPDVPPLPGAEHKVEIGLIPWETRCTTDLDAAEAGPPTLSVWMRTPTVHSELAPALTAYATDLTLIGTALRPIDGVSQHDAGTRFASAVTSHTLWFHRPFRTDEWLMLRQESPILAHGRAFGRGDVLTEDGALVASYAQEALVRFRT